jgi:putative transposase
MGKTAGTEQHTVAYFVTVRTFACKPVFGDRSKALALVDVIDAKRKEMGLKKYAYVVLPDHYHILLGGGPQNQSVADVILAINRAMEHFLALPDDGQPLWDEEPEVLVLYQAASRMEKLNYIHNKPVLCGMVENPEDYEHSSAGFYFEQYGRTNFDGPRRQE